MVSSYVYRLYSSDNKTQIREEYFIFNYKTEGEYKTYYDSGQLFITSNYKNGKLEGECKKYYDSGQLFITSNYKNGKLEGECKEYYDSGQLFITSNYKNGKYEGEYIEYYSNNKIRLICNYKNDELHGAYNNYSFDGQIEDEYYYFYGIKIYKNTLYIVNYLICYSICSIIPWNAILLTWLK